MTARARVCSVVILQYNVSNATRHCNRANGSRRRKVDAMYSSDQV